MGVWNRKLLLRFWCFVWVSLALAACFDINVKSGATVAEFLLAIQLRNLRFQEKKKCLIKTRQFRKRHTGSHNQQSDVAAGAKPWRSRWQEVVGRRWCIIFFYILFTWIKSFTWDFNCEIVAFEHHCDIDKILCTFVMKTHLVTQCVEQLFSIYGFDVPLGKALRPK